MSRVYIVLLLLAFAGCAASSGDDGCPVSSMQEEAYNNRYKDIRRTLALTNQVLSTQGITHAEKARCYNELAYVAYQQMSYDQAYHLLRYIYRTSRNQIDLLCADVMRMKIAQRVGQGKVFFDSRNQALKRLKRIEEEQESLSQEQQKLLYYAKTELRIVSSTYYYYLGQDSSAIHEIHSIDDVVSLGADTAQWLYYNYMLGSGGLTAGEVYEVKLKEFDYLFKTYTVSRATGHVYFEANSLQSIAMALADSVYCQMIRNERPDAYHYLLAQEFCNSRDVKIARELSYPISMANHSLQLFIQCNDLYQTACVYRTLGELYFQAEDYLAALSYYRKALALVEHQKKRSSKSVGPWMAEIFNKLSLTYSALDDKPQSDHYRNLYLDLLDDNRQNRELDSRLEQLQHELNAVQTRVVYLLLLIVLIIILSVFLVLKLNKNTCRRSDSIASVRQSDDYLQLKEKMQQVISNSEEALQEAEDELAACQLHINDYKDGNIERRAKVSLVYAIIPYLDRILAEAKRMEHHVDADRLHYVNELSTEIMSINDVLTDWIKMNQGQLNLHITTFSLSEIFQIIALSKPTYERKGLELQVDDADFHVKADKALTLFMINTLADNARKFTPEGGTVKVQAAAEGDYVEISVNDSGMGLRPEDVTTLNESKYYDPSKLGLSQENKGFGFGIMNCKGIINKYRKLSSKFNVCLFGVESEEGRGSRFWFRLPRIMALLFGLVFCSNAGAQPDSYELYDSMYCCNLSGRFEEAFAYGEQAAERNQSPMDTSLMVAIRNEMAIAAMAMHHWRDYETNNAECVRLHQLYTQDNTLASYCAKMEKAQNDSIVLYVLMLLSAVISLTLFYFLFYKSRLQHRDLYEVTLGHLREAASLIQDFIEGCSACDTSQEESRRVDLKKLTCDLAQLHSRSMADLSRRPDLRALINGLYKEWTSAFDTLGGLQESLSNVQEKYDKAKFEEDRLYVMNQVLDNSLSTIKHETMYYPARIQQMVQFMQQDEASESDVQDLNELALYYKEVYMLLYEQCLRQLSLHDFHKETFSVETLLEHVRLQLDKKTAREGLHLNYTVSESNLAVRADFLLLCSLFRQLFSTDLRGKDTVSVEVEQKADMLQFCIRFIGEEMTEEAAEALFSPATSHIPYLIVKQIIREHDAAYGHPGLRLWACPVEHGYSINFTLLTGK